MPDRPKRIAEIRKEAQKQGVTENGEYIMWLEEHFAARLGDEIPPLDVRVAMQAPLIVQEIGKLVNEVAHLLKRERQLCQMNCDTEEKYRELCRAVRRDAVLPKCACWSTGAFVWVEGCPGHPRESAI